MRAADWKRLAKPLLDQTTTDWGFAKSLAYVAPVDWVAHGLLAEASNNRPGEFYIWAVQMPLIVPLEGVVDLSWSDRLGGASLTYSANSPELADLLTDAASKLIAQERKGGPLIVSDGGAENVRMQEARAYGLALSGDYASAAEVLRRVRRYEAKYQWEHEFHARAEAVASLIESEQFDETARQFGVWRRENCEALGLRCA